MAILRVADTLNIDVYVVVYRANLPIYSLFTFAFKLNA